MNVLANFGVTTDVVDSGMHGRQTARVHFGWSASREHLIPRRLLSSTTSHLTDSLTLTNRDMLTSEPTSRHPDMHPQMYEVDGRGYTSQRVRPLSVRSDRHGAGQREERGVDAVGVAPSNSPASAHWSSLSQPPSDDIM